MPKHADKLSALQMSRLLRAATKWPTATVRVSAVLADDEDVVHETTVAEALDDDAWAEATCESIRDHANGCGRGTWRYAVRVVRDDDRVVGSTWARVVVRAADTDDDDQGLDGSVGSYVQQLQRSLDSQSKSNVELQRLLMQQLESQGKMIRDLFDRQAALERERAELVAASLQDAVDNANKGSGDEMFGELLKFIGPAVGEKLAERFMPMLMGGGGASAPETDAAGEAAGPD